MNNSTNKYKNMNVILWWFAFMFLWSTTAAEQIHPDRIVYVAVGYIIFWAWAGYCIYKQEKGLRKERPYERLLVLAGAIATFMICTGSTF